jgi:hypothetical protein
MIHILCPGDLPVQFKNNNMAAGQTRSQYDNGIKWNTKASLVKLGKGKFVLVL